MWQAINGCGNDLNGALAFVLKLSVVGVRKMDYLGTSPMKSLKSRKSLLNLAKMLEKPGVEICVYIEAEEAALT